METEKEVVKIKTFNGRVITLTISEKTDTHYTGTDKYGNDVILPISEIDELLPITSGGFCPSCNTQTLIPGFFRENGEKIGCNKCTNCGWWG